MRWAILAAVVLAAVLVGVFWDDLAAAARETWNDVPPPPGW
jgi:hypothetical protein